MSFSQGLLKIKENEECRSKSILIAKVAPEVKQNTDADTEITKTCAVSGCEESKNFNSDSFFRFPEDPNLRQIWTDLTGRNNWTPTDYSYICVQHFSVDCFECNADNAVVLVSKAVPSLKLPNHVLEVEYIDEETLANEYEDYEVDESDKNHDVTIRRIANGNLHTEAQKAEDNYELLKLFTEVQKMQRQAVYLSEKLKSGMKIYKRQSRFLMRLTEAIETKRNLLNQKRKKKSRILLSLQDKIKEDTNGLVLAMPTRHTDDLKNFSLSVYKYSPQAYIYIRNTLRTLLPSTDVLDSWLTSGYEPKNVLSSNNLIKVISELTDTELNCKVTLR